MYVQTYCITSCTTAFLLVPAVHVNILKGGEPSVERKKRSAGDKEDKKQSGYEGRSKK